MAAPLPEPAQLPALAPTLAGSAVDVSAHPPADSKGSVPFNMRLSQQRAGSVETWLVQNAGFPVSAFSPVGYGAANPVAPNETPDGHDDPDGRQRNRRVEIVIRKQPHFELVWRTAMAAIYAGAARWRPAFQAG